MGLLTKASAFSSLQSFYMTPIAFGLDPITIAATGLVFKSSYSLYRYYTRPNDNENPQKRGEETKPIAEDDQKRHDTENKL